VSERVRLSDAPLSVDEAIASLAGPDAGAIVTFLGLVRDFNDGRSVTLLEYEAYETMAVREMSRIVADLERELPGVRVLVHHRSGALGVGDLAVICAASAVHRGEAFRACRLAIDRVKANVPIWKREHGPEGPYWVGWQDARCLGEEHEHGEPGHGHGH
jgi:molybdopterin synthase catalytic subunit